MRVAVVFGAVLLVGIGGCETRARATQATTPELCAAAPPSVTVHVAAPPIADGWWYVGGVSDPLESSDPDGDIAGAPGEPEPGAPPDPASIADPGQASDGADDPSDGTDDPSGAGDEPFEGDDSTDDSGDSTTDSWSFDQGRARLSSFAGGSCWTCEITCTMQGARPDQPSAISTSSASSLSLRAACADGERRLVQHASATYALRLDACVRSDP